MSSNNTADRSKAAITKAIPIAVSSLISVVFALAAWRFFISDPNDRYQCNALLNRGTWLDDGLTTPDTLTNWQPDGCMLASYNPKTATQCLSGRRLVFAGDSTVRQLFYATAKLLDPGLNVPDYYSNPPAASADDKKHQDVTLSIGGGAAGPASSTAITLEFVWDAFLNSSKVLDMLEGPMFGAIKKPKPALFVLGTGLWQLRQLGESGMSDWSQSIDRVFAAAQPGHTQIADEVILLPVQRVVTDKLNDQRRPTITPQAIERMNIDLMRRLPTVPDRSAAGTSGIAGGVGQLSIPYVFNDMISSASNPAAHTHDGIHFDAVFTKPMITILMNLRCNDVLPKSFPFAKTCCNQYPAPNWVQGSLILLTLLSGPLLGQAVAGKTAAWLKSIAPSQQVCTAISIFGFGVIYQYFCDRTSLFMKVQKQFEFWPVTLAMLASLALGLFTLKKPEKDLGFLNRDQTDEWKGWMQIAILIYHYWGASKVSGIYNPIRVLVAAYLFMSGYGHFYFYYKKADFGLARIAAVLIRLNLLTLVLAYIQDTDYLSYYFSPLTTLWFIVIWLTMYIGHTYNATNAPFLLAKIGVSAALMTAMHKLTWPLDRLFGVYNAVFATQWNAREWSFRVTLDMWIVYVGMLSAYAVIAFNDNKLWDRPSWPIVRKYGTALAAVAMIGYIAFELQFDKFTYNTYHPYISFVPVLAFAVLRNATPLLRSTSSKAYIWIGQCSLETFICQFHIWLGGDTKGILMLLPFPRWRTLNMVVSTIIFLFVSHHIARATGEITDSIGGKTPRPSPSKRPSVAPVNGDAAGSNYVALAVLEPGTKNGMNGTSGEVKLSAHSRQPSVSQSPPGPIGKMLSQLPVRIALIMLSLWILNLLYPTGHPNEGHLLPLSH